MKEIFYLKNNRNYEELKGKSIYFRNGVNLFYILSRYLKNISINSIKSIKFIYYFFINIYEYSKIILIICM